jgi:hypothetical protein
MAFKSFVTGLTLVTLSALAPMALGADILDTVGQPGAEQPAAVTPAPAPRPQVVKRTSTHAAHKASKQHKVAAKAKRVKIKKSKAKRHAAAKHRHAHKARG